MMKIWMVIFIGSRVFAVWADPMPSDMTFGDCQIKASRWNGRTMQMTEPEEQPVYACVRRWFRPRKGEVARALSTAKEKPEGER